jgi:UDP-3-O-[3-hydroxymyristoyl] N-acetylglucosamine deacetylase
LRPQQTLTKDSVYEGIGLHSGEKASMRFCPAEENTGIRFRRIDIPGSPEIPAAVEYVWDTSRSTNIGIGEAKVLTVEHVLAAFRACNVDNVIVELTGPEPPIADGSSRPYIEMILESGIQEQKAMVEAISLQNPVYYSKGDIHLVAVPSDEYRISYTLHYPQAPLIKSQYFSFVVNQENFINEVAPCRTFSLYKEVSYLIDKGLIKGGSLENAVIITDDAILSKEGLRFPDEMVRHKVLDLIGDLSLVGFPFKAHVMAICSGHASNVALAKEILKQINKESRQCLPL